MTRLTSPNAPVKIEPLPWEQLYDADKGLPWNAIERLAQAL